MGGIEARTSGPARTGWYCSTASGRPRESAAPSEGRRSSAGPERRGVRRPRGGRRPRDRDPSAGRSLVTRRAIRDLVRTAVLSAYGVTGFAGGGPIGRLLERAGLAHPGLRVEVGDELVVDLRLTVAYGLPIAEVARQVESSVRYTLRHAHRVASPTGSRSGSAGSSTSRRPRRRRASPRRLDPGPSDLAGSGSDVA